MKPFKPFKAPNEEVKLEDMKLPLIVSKKLDGIRCIFKDGQMLTSHLKQFPNVQLAKRFEYLIHLSKQDNIILDGELLAKSLSFNELSGLCRRLEEKLPDDLMFYCFDMVTKEHFDIPFEERLEQIQGVELSFIPFVALPQYKMNSYEEIKSFYEKALTTGKCDGLILRNPRGKYKLGRATVKEALIYKLKPFRTFDAHILDVLEGTIVKPQAEKTINELGNSVTSKKKGDRLPSGKASDFVVMHEGHKLKVAIAMTDEEKKEVWLNKETYIGRWIEYKGMLIGAKDLPRHPVFLRFRRDKEN
jgi:DNA ligase-1